MRISVISRIIQTRTLFPKIPVSTLLIPPVLWDMSSKSWEAEEGRVSVRDGQGNVECRQIISVATPANARGEKNIVYFFKVWAVKNV